MSKRLTRAIASGKVSVTNRTAGEAVVWVPQEDGSPDRRITIPPYATVELAPKYTKANLLTRSRNLPRLLRKTLSVS